MENLRQYRGPRLPRPMRSAHDPYMPRQAPIVQDSSAELPPIAKPNRWASVNDSSGTCHPPPVHGYLYPRCGPKPILP